MNYPRMCKCIKPETRLGRLVCINGMVQVRRQCTSCGGRSGYSVALDEVWRCGLDPCELPIIESYLKSHEGDIEYAKEYLAAQPAPSRPIYTGKRSQCNRCGKQIRWYKRNEKWMSYESNIDVRHQCNKEGH